MLHDIETVVSTVQAVQVNSKNRANPKDSGEDFPPDQDREKIATLLLERHAPIETRSATEMATAVQFFRSLGYANPYKSKARAREEGNRTLP